MTNPSPLLEVHPAMAERAQAEVLDRMAQANRPGAATAMPTGTPEVEWIRWGVVEADHGFEPPVMVATYGPVEVEYAAVRRRAGLIDLPCRGTLVVTGGERVDFLDRLLTQKVAGLAAGGTAEAFLLNRQGRIVADLGIAELGDLILIDVDLHQAHAAAEVLESYLFTEDVAIEQASDRLHRLGLHGPAAASVLARASGEPAGEDAARTFGIDGHAVVAVRRDLVGEPGWELTVDAAAAADVWSALLASDPAPRPIGWLALNIARVEAGTPLINVDFGTDGLPAETGVLDRRVSFTKGCYPGQEIVARMHNLGKPKQRLVGLRCEDGRLPMSGAPVHELPEGPDAGSFGPIVGAVTSSTLSPMRGQAPIALAMIRGAHAEEGTKLLVEAEGGWAPVTVGPLGHLQEHGT